MRSRPLWLSFALIAVTIPAGLMIRFAHAGLPPWFSKYGGSVLWAIMIYWLVSTLLPRWTVPRSAIASAVLSAAVEFFKLVYTPALDAFRHTLPGMLLLGRVFSLWDIAAYWAGIACAACIDMALRKLCSAQNCI